MKSNRKGWIYKLRRYLLRIVLLYIIMFYRLLTHFKNLGGCTHSEILFSKQLMRIGALAILDALDGNHVVVLTCPGEK